MNSPIANEVKKSAESSDTAVQVRQRKLEQREKSKNLAADLKTGIVKTYRLLEDDDDFKQMRAPYTNKFYETWSIGFKSYIDGDWIKAKKHFEITLVISIDLDNAFRNN